MLGILYPDGTRITETTTRKHGYLGSKLSVDGTSRLVHGKCRSFTACRSGDLDWRNDLTPSRSCQRRSLAVSPAFCIERAYGCDVRSSSRFSEDCARLCEPSVSFWCKYQRSESRAEYQRRCERKLRVNAIDASESQKIHASLTTIMLYRFYRSCGRSGAG